VSIDVPERCAPVMQTAVWVSAILFPQRPYTTMTRPVRQADCSVPVRETTGSEMDKIFIA